MNRVAAEIAQKIGVFFQDNHLHARAREKEAKHHSGRAAANDDATCCNSSGDLATNRDEWTRVHKTVLRATPKIILKGDYCCKIDITASATSWTLTAFIQRKSIGQFRRKHGLHST